MRINCLLRSFGFALQLSFNIQNEDDDKKKDIIALFYHFIDTPDRILILISPVTLRHIHFDIFKRFDSNLSHPQLKGVG